MDTGGERSHGQSHGDNALRSLRARVSGMERELAELQRNRVAGIPNGGKRSAVLDDTARGGGWLNNEDTSNVRIPTGWSSSLARRLRYLEIRFSSLLGWVNNPHNTKEVHHRCANKTDLHPEDDKRSVCCSDKSCHNAEGTCTEGHRNYDHVICWDNWKKDDEPCVIYDFGLRAEPHFGVHMAERGCEVHGFDPSPARQDFAEHFRTLGLRVGRHRPAHDPQLPQIKSQRLCS